MLDFLFNPLARAQRRLKKVEKFILQDEALILHPDKNKIKGVKTFNKYIRKSLYKVRAIFSKEAKKHASDADNKEYLKCIGISMKIDKAFNILSIIEHQIVGSESALRGLGDAEFTNAWLKDMRTNYDQMIFCVQQIEHELVQLEAVSETIKKKVREPASRNQAEFYLRNGRLLTKAEELRRLARSCGYTIIDGRRHILVIDANNHRITAIPRHKEINGRTAQKIMEELATAA